MLAEYEQNESRIWIRNSKSCLALVVVHTRAPAYIRPSSAFAEKISVSSFHVGVYGQSVIYDHRRALKASRLSLLNVRYSVCSSGRLLFYPFFALSLFTFYVPPPIHVVRCMRTHVNSREYTRTSISEEAAS